MRIIAGMFKSRRLVTLSGPNTRPMTDKMKESVFNIIGPYFDGGNVLDLFGGSGALSFESISRGVNSAIIVDKSLEASGVIRKNISSFELESQVKLLTMDYNYALNKISKFKKTFDIVFIDPPYNLKVIDKLLNDLLEKQLVKQSSYIICHYYKNNHLPVETDKLKIIKNTSYGSSEFCIYQVR